MESDPNLYRTPEPADASFGNAGSTAAEPDSLTSPTANLEAISLTNEDASRPSGKRDRSESPIFEPETPEASISDAPDAKRLKFEATTPPHEQQQTFTFSISDFVLPANCPPLAAFFPLFSQTEKDIAKICDIFIAEYDRLKEEGFQNAEIASICEQLSKLRDVKKHYPLVKPVALTGPMGAGKSRTINSLLDQAGVALDSDSSDRGTNVVHEYLGPEPGQTKKYHVNVVYYSLSQLDRRLTKTVTSLYAFLELKYSQTDPDDGDDDDLRSRYKSAVDFLRVTLCDHEDFSTRDATEDFLNDHYQHQCTKIEDLVKILGKYIVELKAARGVVDDVEAHVAHDEDELSQIFANVSKPRDPTPKHPHPWPLIEKIQIRVRDNELLRRGTTLADTPGVADSDELVRHNTSSYLHNVGMVLIVSPILRTQRLNDLNDILRMCLHLGKAENTYLVMTKIDQKDEYRPSHKNSLKLEFRQTIEKAEACIAELKEEMAQRNAKTHELMQKIGNGQAAVAEFQTNHGRLSELPKEIRKQEHRIFQSTVKARNSDTEELLKGKFRDLAKSGRAPDLKTLFISNEEYSKIAQGTARLDLAATGIPLLQRHLYQASAVDKFGTLRNLVKDHIRVSFQGVVLALTQSKLKRKEEVEHHLTAALNEWSAITDSFRKSIDFHFQRCIVDTFKDKDLDWKNKTKRHIKEWASFYASNFSAFCRREGTWKPKKKGGSLVAELSWNQELQKVYSTDLGTAFGQFWESFDEIESIALTQIREWLKNVEETLKTCPEFQGVSDTALFYDMLRGIRERTEHSIYGLTKSLRRKLERVQTLAIVETQEKNGFLDIAMHPIYQAAQAIQPKRWVSSDGKKTWGGQGAHKERVDLIRRKVLGIDGALGAVGVDQGTEDEDEDEADLQPSIFRCVLEQTQAAFDQRVHAGVQKMASQLQTTSTNIVTDFNRRYSDEDEAAIDPMFKEQLLGHAYAALKKLHGPIKAQLEECLRVEEEAEKA